MAQHALARQRSIAKTKANKQLDLYKNIAYLNK